MLDIKIIRENPELIKKNSKNRLSVVDIDILLALDTEVRTLISQSETARARRNQASKTKPTPEIIAEMKNLGESLKKWETELIEQEAKLKEMLMSVPNLTHPDVRVSDNEDDNPVLKIYGQPTKFKFSPKDHVELAESLDLIDFDRATKVSGAKFYYLKNELALMEYALIQYSLGILVKRGFTPFTTPDLAKREVLEGMGYSPRGESTQIYNIENSDLSLIGTAEITMGGYHKDEVFEEADLPKKYAAVSHCFRTEAGSYSKFSKGVFRVHQFTKIEMFAYVKPSEAEKTHLELLEIEKKIFKGLGLPFQVIDHCTADLGAPSIRTYDLEAWMPGKPAADGNQGAWAEVTSTSNCTDYQSRALNTKYRRADGEKELVYTLNGTAIAIPRCLIAILENYQNEDGSIDIPKALVPYMPKGYKKISRQKK
ncbi:MAG: serine--tRNA ligase [Patescibacteria group bacterium]|jgi:seryl-tRNA synthetase